MSYSASNNNATVKSGPKITQGRWKWSTQKLGYDFLFAFYSNYLVSFL